MKQRNLPIVNTNKCMDLLETVSLFQMSPLLHCHSAQTEQRHFSAALTVLLWSISVTRGDTWQHHDASPMT